MATLSPSNLLTPTRLSDVTRSSLCDAGCVSELPQDRRDALLGNTPTLSARALEARPGFGGWCQSVRSVVAGLIPPSNVDIFDGFVAYVRNRSSRAYLGLGHTGRS